MALRGEEVERVSLAERQAEGVQRHLRRLRIVYAAQIDDQLAVDEDEDVVVARNWRTRRPW